MKWIERFVEKLLEKNGSVLVGREGGQDQFGGKYHNTCFSFL